MKDFETWFADLCDNYVWHSPASMHHRPETFKKLAHKVYMEYVAKEFFPSIQEARIYVYRIICKTPGDNQKVDWAAKALEKMEKKDEWKPVSWEKRAEYLKQVQAEIDKIDDKRIRPLLKGEAEERGQCDPPKPRATGHPSAPIEVVIDIINRTNNARRKYFLEKNPEASEEEITEYLKQFKTI